MSSCLGIVLDFPGFHFFQCVRALSHGATSCLSTKLRWDSSVPNVPVLITNNLARCGHALSEKRTITVQKFNVDRLPSYPDYQSDAVIIGVDFGTTSKPLSLNLCSILLDRFTRSCLQRRQASNPCRRAVYCCMGRERGALRWCCSQGAGRQRPCQCGVRSEKSLWSPVCWLRMLLLTSPSDSATLQCKTIANTGRSKPLTVEAAFASQLLLARMSSRSPQSKLRR